jgi:hypothetical protein
VDGFRRRGEEREEGIRSLGEEERRRCGGDFPLLFGYFGYLGVF